MRTILPFILMLLFSAQAYNQPIISQTDLSPWPFQVYQLYNKLNVMSGAPSGSNKVTFYVRSGSTYEYDSLLGINLVLSEIINNRLSSSAAAASLKVETMAGKEWTRFRISGLNDAAQAASLWAAAMKQLPADSAEVLRAMGRVNQKSADLSKDENEVFKTEMIRALYRKDAEKLLVTGSPESRRRINLEYLRDWADRFYVPNNCVMLVQTGENKEAMLQSISNTLIDQWKPSAYDPEMITKIVDFKPLVHSLQIRRASNNSPELRYGFQAAGVQQNTFYSSCALVMASLFEAPEGYLQQTLKNRLGAESIEVVYTPGCYTSTFELAVKASDTQMPSIAAFLNQQFRLLDIDSAISYSLFENAKERALRKLQLLRKAQADSAAEVIITDWNTNASLYGLFFMQAEDLLKNLKRDAFMRYTVELFNTNNYAVFLSSPLPETDSAAWFYETNAEIKDSIITFRNNVHDLEGKENFLILDKLAAFLQINEEVQLQVNGLCDKAEFNKARDPKILAFIDSVPTFARVKPEIVKKGYLGLDMMRAMQVLYYLYGKGIDMKRISGTGMSYSSPGDTDPAENRKVIFNIERLKPLQSVRSFGLSTR